MKNHENPLATMENQPWIVKNHENPPETINNQPEIMKNHENLPATMKNQPWIMKKPWKPTWNHENPWLQVVAGDSKEEVMIFHDKHKQTEPSYNDDEGNEDDDNDNYGRVRSCTIRSQESTNPLTVPVSKVELLWPWQTNLEPWKTPKCTRPNCILAWRSSLGLPPVGRHGT